MNKDISTSLAGIDGMASLHRIADFKVADTGVKEGRAFQSRIDSVGISASPLEDNLDEKASTPCPRCGSNLQKSRSYIVARPQKHASPCEIYFEICPSGDCFRRQVAEKRYKRYDGAGGRRAGT